MMEILKSLSKTFLVILVSHDRELVEEYSDRIITMKDGGITKDTIIHETDKQTAEPKRSKKKGLLGALSKTFKIKSRTNIFAALAAAAFVGIASLSCSFFTGNNQKIVGVDNKYVSLPFTTLLSADQYDSLSNLGVFLSGGYAASDSRFDFPDNGFTLGGPSGFSLSGIPVSAEIKGDETIIYG